MSERRWQIIATMGMVAALVTFITLRRAARGLPSKPTAKESYVCGKRDKQRQWPQDTQSKEGQTQERIAELEQRVDQLERDVIRSYDILDQILRDRWPSE